MLGRRFPEGDQFVFFRSDGRAIQAEFVDPDSDGSAAAAPADVSGRRFIAADWNVWLPAAQAAEGAGAPVAWLSIARMPIEPG